MMKETTSEIRLTYVKLLYIINVLVFNCIRILLTRSDTKYIVNHLCEANFINQWFSFNGILVLHKCSNKNTLMMNLFCTAKLIFLKGVSTT